MADFDAVFTRYLAVRQAAGAPDWPTPADETQLAALCEAVAPLVVPDQLLALWHHANEGPAWLVDAGDLVSPRTALDWWNELQALDSLPYPTVLLPIAFANHIYLAIELGYPPLTTGGVLLRLAYGEIEPVAPDLSTALDLAASTIEERSVTWAGQWWDGVDFEARQRDEAGGMPWPPHLADVGAVNANLPLTWPSVWQRATGIDLADAVPLGATATISDLQRAQPGPGPRIAARVVGLVGSAAGTLATLSDESGSLECWCPRAADPFFAVRKGQAIEVDVVVQDGGEVPPADAHTALVAAPNGRFRATLVRSAIL